MQKKLIALAVAGLVSAPVFAQSNIQIYGVADAYMKYGDFMGDDSMGVDSGGLMGSRLGFRGEESAWIPDGPSRATALPATASETFCDDIVCRPVQPAQSRPCAS